MGAKAPRVILRMHGSPEHAFACSSQLKLAIRIYLRSLLFTIELDERMTIYHNRIKVHSRAGRRAANAVRSAAYRAGSKLVDEVTGAKYNFAYKSEVKFSEIRTPANAPERFKNRQTLWSEVERKEIRCDAQLFREHELALPIELTLEQNKELMREYIDRTMTMRGIIADYSIHLSPGNPHVHIMATMRDVEENGFGNKNRGWNDKKYLAECREIWAELVNKHLAKAGIDARVDHRSYAEQGLDIEPTMHEGREGIGKENAQKVKARKKENRRIRKRNQNARELKTSNIELAAITAQIAEAQLPEQSSLTILRKKMLTSLRPVEIALSLPDNEPVPNIIKANSEPAPVVKLANINKRILQSVNAVGAYHSTSTAMVVYQAPKLELSESGIERAYIFNIPANPLDAQGCYALRAILGVKEANTEFNKRQSALRLVGMNYAWRDFYDEIRDGCKLKHGAMHSWWRAYARMCFKEHSSELLELVKAVPDRYKETVNSLISDELKKAHVLPDQPSSAVWVVVKSVEPESKSEPVNPEPVAPKVEPVRNPPPDIPPPQQKHVEEAAPVKPFNPYPDPYAYPKPKNPWDSGGFNPW